MLINHKIERAMAILELELIPVGFWAEYWSWNLHFLGLQHYPQPVATTHLQWLQCNFQSVLDNSSLCSFHNLQQRKALSH